jgi:membrane protein DedA with SNARE-associated domain
MPSEVILPLAGSLSASGTFNPFLVLLSAVIGSCLGATFLYSVGRYGGERRIAGWLDRYGKWVLLGPEDLYTTRDWFGRHGTWAVMVARILPGMRTFVSVPAGLASMPYPRFIMMTAIGAALWNGFLVGAGYVLGKNWAQVQGWIAPFGPIIYGIIILLVVGFVARRLWMKFGPPARQRARETTTDAGK